MENEESIFPFDLRESVFFEDHQQISEISGISLEPEISIQTYGDYVSIRGVIDLQGEYRSVDNSVVEQLEQSFEKQAIRYINTVEADENGFSLFSHQFPIEISVPLYRVRDLDEVSVSIDSFDYTIPDPAELVVDAEISIHGISNQTTREPEPFQPQGNVGKEPEAYRVETEQVDDAKREKESEEPEYASRQQPDGKSEDQESSMFDIKQEKESMEQVESPTRQVESEEPEYASRQQPDGESEDQESSMVDIKQEKESMEQVESPTRQVESEEPEYASRQQPDGESEDRESSMVDIKQEKESTEQVESPTRQVESEEPEYASRQQPDGESEDRESSMFDIKQEKESTEQAGSQTRQEEPAGQEYASRQQPDGKSEDQESFMVDIKQEKESSAQLPYKEKEWPESFTGEQERENPKQVERVAKEYSPHLNDDRESTDKNRDESSATGDKSFSAQQDQEKYINEKPSLQNKDFPDEESSSGRWKWTKTQSFDDFFQKKQTEESLEPESTSTGTNTGITDTYEPADMVDESLESSSYYPDRPAFDKKKQTKEGLEESPQETAQADINYLSDIFEAREEAEQQFTKMKLCIVQDKDTLESIAERYQITSMHIIKKNSLESENISPGQLLYIPLSQKEY